VVNCNQPEFLGLVPESDRQLQGEYIIYRHPSEINLR
jgi:hypothetical protein